MAYSPGIEISATLASAASARRRQRARRLGSAAAPSAAAGGRAELALGGVERADSGPSTAITMSVGAGVAAHAERGERLEVRRRAHRHLGAAVLPRSSFATRISRTLST